MAVQFCPNRKINTRIKTPIVRVLRTILANHPILNSSATNIETLAFFLRLWYTEDI